MAFYGLSKLPFASPQTLQNSPNAPNAPNPPKPAKPSKHRPQTTAGWTLSSSKPSKPLSLNSFPNRHPRARPQQWLSMGFQSCRLPARKGSNPLQNSKPPGPGPQQWDFLWISKLPFASPQRLQTFQNKIPNTPSPTGTPGPRPLPEQAPQGQGQGHFPNRHPRARPQQWLSIGFQSCRLPARKPSKTFQTLQTPSPGPGTPANEPFYGLPEAGQQPQGALRSPPLAIGFSD